MNIFLLAGGFGTRLKSVVRNTPKPMAPILNKPFIEYQIKMIREFFPNTIIYILTHYLSNIIEDYFKHDNTIMIIKEDTPLGTGGSIYNAIKSLKLNIDEKLLVFNGDTYIKPNLFEITKSNNLTIVASFKENCERYGTLTINNNTIIDFKEKDILSKNSYINCGCYFFNDLDFFSNIIVKKFDIEEKFKQYIHNNLIKIYKYDKIFIDIGIPKDYFKMIQYMSNINE